METNEATFTAFFRGTEFSTTVLVNLLVSLGLTKIALALGTAMVAIHALVSMYSVCKVVKTGK